MSLRKYIPDPELLVRMAPEQVAKQLLKVCVERTQNGIFSLGAVAGRDALFGQHWSGETGYTSCDEVQVELAAAEAFRWLELSLLIMPAPEPNKTFSRLTRLGRNAVKSDSAFDALASARRFPREFLHHLIADDVWLQLSLGKFDIAVFTAFRAVEEQVRLAGRFTATDVGVNLVRKAFQKDTGPLTRLSDPDAEREALSSLFSGAIGSYKNPHSHRTVASIDSEEAQEMVLLASHLLRIVDDRRTQ